MAGPGLLSCARILLCKQQPHPVTKGPGSFFLSFFSLPFRSFSITPHLAHICTGERTAVRRMHVGGRPESQVCPAAAASAAAAPAAGGGGGGTVDGWRSDGGGPAGLLSGEVDSKQANTHAHTQTEKKERKKEKNRNSVDKHFTQSVISQRGR